MTAPCRILWEFDVPEGGGWLLNYPLCQVEDIQDAIFAIPNSDTPDWDIRKRIFQEEFNKRFGEDHSVIGVAPSEPNYKGFDVYSGIQFVDLLFASKNDAMLFKLTHGGEA